MTRYLSISSVRFGNACLAGPRAMRLLRLASPAPAGADADAMPTHLELLRAPLTVELTVRDTAAAESLQLGSRDNLTIVLLGDRGDAPARTIVVAGAILIGVELSYPQGSPAEAILRFAAVSDDGQSEPLTAEDPT